MKIINILLKLLLCTLIFVNILNIVSYSYEADVFDSADKFLEAGKENESEYVNEEAVKTASNNIYNIFFTIGIIVAIIVGIILGIQFIVSGIDGKAKVKEALIAYGVGCVVLFGAFGIWKLVITVFSNIKPV